MSIVKKIFERDQSSSLFYLGLEHLESGIVINPGNGIVTNLQITEENGTIMNFKIQLEENKEILNPQIQPTTFENEIVFKISYSQSLANFGFSFPFPVGTYNEFGLWFNCRVDLNSTNDSALIQYSFYTSKLQ